MFCGWSKLLSRGEDRGLYKGLLQGLLGVKAKARAVSSRPGGHPRRGPTLLGVHFSGFRDAGGGRPLMASHSASRSASHPTCCAMLRLGVSPHKLPAPGSGTGPSPCHSEPPGELAALSVPLHQP